MVGELLAGIVDFNLVHRVLHKDGIESSRGFFLTFPSLCRRGSPRFL